MNSFQRFEGLLYLHLQGQAAALLLGLPDRKMKTRRATTLPPTRPHTPKIWIMTPAVISLRTKHKIPHLFGQVSFKTPNSNPSSSMKAYMPCSLSILVQFYLIKDNGKQVILEKGNRLKRRRKAGVNLPMYGICVWLGIVAFLKKIKVKGNIEHVYGMKYTRESGNLAPLSFTSALGGASCSDWSTHGKNLSAPWMGPRDGLDVSFTEQDFMSARIPIRTVPPRSLATMSTPASLFKHTLN